MGSDSLQHAHGDGSVGDLLWLMQMHGWRTTTSAVADDMCGVISVEAAVTVSMSAVVWLAGLSASALVLLVGLPTLSLTLSPTAQDLRYQSIQDHCLGSMITGQILLVTKHIIHLKNDR